MATIIGQQVGQFGFYGGGTGDTYTIEVNFEPSFIVGQINLAYIGTEGLDLARASVQGYRHRDTPDGSEVAVDFTDMGFYLPDNIAGDNITSVTFSLMVTAKTDADAVYNQWCKS